MQKLRNIIVVCGLIFIGLIVYLFVLETKLDNFAFVIYWSIFIFSVFVSMARKLFVIFSIILIIASVVAFLFETELGEMAYYIQRSSTWSFYFFATFIVFELLSLRKS